MHVWCLDGLMAVGIKGGTKEDQPRNEEWKPENPVYVDNFGIIRFISVVNNGR